GWRGACVGLALVAAGIVACKGAVGDAGPGGGTAGSTISGGAGAAGVAVGAGGAGGAATTGAAGSVAGPLDIGITTAIRLNRTQYNNTVRDLLGTALTPADNFPP